MIDWVHAGEATYEERRAETLWNGRLPGRRPLLIATPREPGEVAVALRRIAPDAARVFVKSGGHSWIGAFLHDGAALLDLSQLKRIEVDAVRRRALVEPGATHRELAMAIVRHGLAFPIGHCPSVGLGGYLLAGGYGWNPRRWGPACWSVEALEVVDSRGESLLADSEHHAELLWAARGGGPGFPAVVTRFHLRLHPLPRMIGRRDIYRLSALPALASWIAGALGAAPTGLELSLIARHEVRSAEPIVVLAATAFADTLDEAASIVTAADSTPCQDLLLERPPPQPVALSELEGDGGWVRGLRYAVDSCDYDIANASDVGERLVAQLNRSPSRMSRLVLAFADFPNRSVESAFQPSSPSTLSTYATWESPADDADNVEWLMQTMQQIRPFTTGHYSGETDLFAEPSRFQRCFSPGIWERLRQVRTEYDPDGRLSLGGA